ncbi:TPA: phosphoadenosine phosphosulfate reductase family protein [Pseudomonas aeruginosa]|nr:phosphoadenosine phosphosulfate reductase family protein [Pseudomonas aeruginosa]
MTSAQTKLTQSIQAGLFDAAEPAPVLLQVVDLTFDEKVKAAVEAIKQQVREGRRLVVAWSGGKDSSVTLNLAFTALRDLIAKGHSVPALHVIHSNTGLENPVIEIYNKGQIRAIKAYAKTAGIETRVWVASPNLSNDYLVGLLSGRTIMSVGNNTKCQQMMKKSALDRIKRQVRAWIAEKDGVKAKDANLVSLIGTRFEESAQRAARMKARGESSTEAVDAMEDGQLVLSPIAEWDAFEIFTYIGHVRSEKIEAYSDFEELVDIYRDANGGDCMVNQYISGREQNRPPCSARTGCWACGRISKDTSAENMISAEGGKHAWMKPLLDLRNYMLARHFDPSARCWLARTINEETGTIKIVPNAYAPEYTLDLLRLILTVQVREQIAARKLGIAPRFHLLDHRQLIALDCLWGRYQYQRSFMALRTWKEIYEQGKRYDIPDLASIPKYTEKDVSFRAEVPFADEEYFAAWRGFRNVEAAAVDWEDTTVLPNGKIVQNANVGDEFEIDEEGAALFWEFDLDYALNRISVLDNPSGVVHYLVGLGTVTLYKGSLGEWDRMMRVGNQAWFHGLMPIINDPHALVETLQAKFQKKEEDKRNALIGQLALFL